MFPHRARRHAEVARQRRADRLPHKLARRDVSEVGRLGDALNVAFGNRAG
jgi:hypothetical protein